MNTTSASLWTQCARYSHYDADSDLTDSAVIYRRMDHNYFTIHLWSRLDRQSDTDTSNPDAAGGTHLWARYSMKYKPHPTILTGQMSPWWAEDWETSLAYATSSGGHACSADLEAAFRTLWDTMRRASGPFGLFRLSALYHAKKALRKSLDNAMRYKLIERRYELCSSGRRRIDDGLAYRVSWDVERNEVLDEGGASGVISEAERCCQ